MAYDAERQQVVVFGGSPEPGTALADTWTWDGTNWTQESPSTNPSPRYNSNMAYDAAQQQILLFGGLGFVGGSATNFLADTWVWNGTNWTQEFPTTLPPPARAVHGMTYDSAHAQVVLFGGSTATTLFGDTWVYGAPTASGCPTGTGTPVNFGGGNNSTNPSGFTNEPINTATGNYFLSRSDLTVPGKGLAFTFTRSYNSLDTYAGPLGSGWTHSYNILLTADPSSGAVTVKEADGHQDSFTAAGGGAYTPQFPACLTAS